MKIVRAAGRYVLAVLAFFAAINLLIWGLLVLVLTGCWLNNLVGGTWSVTGSSSGRGDLADLESILFLVSLIGGAAAVVPKEPDNGGN